MRPRWADWLLILVSLLVVGVFTVVAWKLGLFQAVDARKLSSATGHVVKAGWLPFVFVVIFGIVGALPLPITPLALGAGAVFGFVRGSILVWLGSMLGATVGYFLARSVWGDTVRRLLGRHREKLHGVRKGNVTLMALRMRLMPILPFGVFNYAAAISKLPPTSFLIGTAVGIIPGTLLSTFVGDRFIAGISSGDKQPLLVAAAVTLLLLGLSFLPRLLKTLRKGAAR
jgi:uncharacterized membrane protein YdjX (TVP38/TMEM64 family)